MDKRSEYRSVKFETVAQRAEENGPVKLVLRGYPILFNTETRIYDWWYGEIREIILPTALDEVRLDDVYLLVGHNPDNILGRVKVNMRAEVDETGLFIECELPNTQFARDTYNLVESGILDGMSFGFTCSDQVNEATLTRTITRIDELFEEQIPIETAGKDEIVTGPATVRCFIDNELKEYEIRVTDIDMSGTEINKGLVIQVTDPELLEKTGGIIQGMSGSPIIQNGKLIGAVTHVFVQDSTMGYGIFIENMLEQVE